MASGSAERVEGFGRPGLGCRVDKSMDFFLRV